MSNIPDFAMQVQEVQRQIEAQCDVTAQDWKDAVQKRYYDNYMNAYKENMELYIHGGYGISGKGINELLVFIDEQMQKMEALTGISSDVTFMCAAGASHTGSVRDNIGVNIPVEAFYEIQERGGIVHNNKRERDYWRDDDTRPGQYSNEEIKQIMDYRSQNDFYKDFKY